MKFYIADDRLGARMEENRYKEWDAIFAESNQRDFKEELKQWLREHKGDLMRLCKERKINCVHKSPYGMLSELMDISVSSINNWMSLKAQKLIPEERVVAIRKIMAEVSHMASMQEPASDAQLSAEEDKEAFVQSLKEKLSYEAIGRFYMEADKAGMSLDAYLLSLLK